MEKTISQETKFCPKCRKLAFRVINSLPEPEIGWEFVNQLDIEALAEVCRMPSTVRVLVAPSWGTALSCPGNVSNISFGCPHEGCKGKIVVGKK